MQHDTEGLARIIWRTSKYAAVMKHVLAVNRSAPQMMISASPNGTPNAPNSSFCTPGLARLICIHGCHYEVCTGIPFHTLKQVDLTA